MPALASEEHSVNNRATLTLTHSKNRINEPVIRLEDLLILLKEHLFFFFAVAASCYLALFVTLQRAPEHLLNKNLAHTSEQLQKIGTFPAPRSTKNSFYLRER